MSFMMGAMLAGAGISAIGKYQEGQAAKAMASYNEDVANQQAQAIRQKTAFDIELNRDKAKRLLSAQRLAFAKSGVDIQEGTPLDVMLQQVKDSEFENLALQYSGDMAARKAESQADIYRLQGEQAETSGYVGAIGSLLGGIGNAAYSQTMGNSKNKTYDDLWGSP